jgi:acyl-CoA reductase-like NAD-dependent aldehyde dehydrogenase
MLDATASIGAPLTSGGRRPPDRDHGWFVEPTIFAEVDAKATIAQQEIFGPVLAPVTSVCRLKCGPELKKCRVWAA